MKLHRLLALTLLLASIFLIGKCQDDDEDMMMVDDDEDFEIEDEMMDGMEDEEEPAPKVTRPPKYFTAPEIDEGTYHLAEAFLNANSLGSK